jgi:hypothetical protein
MTEFDNAIAETVTEDMPWTGDDVMDSGTLLDRLPGGRPLKRKFLGIEQERRAARLKRWHTKQASVSVYAVPQVQHRHLLDSTVTLLTITTASHPISHKLGILRNLCHSIILMRCIFCTVFMEFGARIVRRNRISDNPDISAGVFMRQSDLAPCGAGGIDG